MFLQCHINKKYIHRYQQKYLWHILNNVIQKDLLPESVKISMMRDSLQVILSEFAKSCVHNIFWMRSRKEHKFTVFTEYCPVNISSKFYNK